jgi:site-specific DNA-methyltransferase (adenine-specific)
MDDNIVLLNGDCLDVFQTLEADIVDSIVTDPPYGLSFMGKDWDHGVPGEHFWAEALRVAKPGAHLLAFGGTRTFHRLAVAIEDAGWEIRDTVMWVYGSGFPKSLDISKALDKAAGKEREVVGVKPGHEGFAGRKTKGHIDFKDGTEGFDRPWMHDDAKRAAYHMATAPATDEAKQWEGWGTALKPAYEPIIVARKPLIGTVAANVLAHGTGGINVDGCRVGTSKNVPTSISKRAPANCYGKYAEAGETPGIGGHDPNIGRWPANLIHDGSEEVLACFPDSKGQQGAARFFYCAKASKSDRGVDNKHPTVKPTALMRYLCRLVTPPGGTVLDPFMGSGSTGKAAILEGFKFIGIEKNAEYVEMSRARIEHVNNINTLSGYLED